MESEAKQKYLRALPAVDELLRHPSIQDRLGTYSRGLVIESIRKVLEEKRQAILKSTTEEEAAAVEVSPPSLSTAVEKELSAITRASLRHILNATGVILHTNLGRAPLAEEALQNIIQIASGYSNLEFNLATGERGSRYVHVEEILCRLTGAESALAVNNNAGAVLLALNSLAEGKEVIVSRGELVEIGGSFRIPDVMKKSGARLVEVGTTNRTYVSDYERAIGENTALLLKVHTSNYRIMGFAAEVSLEELRGLGRSRGIPVMQDLGSGCLVDLSPYSIEKEPTVRDAVASGVDLVTFSGDKLLGGPQSGILLGKKEYLNVLKKNPLTRALRIDKLTLAGLEATLRLYLNPDQAIRKLPALVMLTWSREELEGRAERLAQKLRAELGPVCELNLRDEISQAGGGSLPVQVLPTRVIALRPRQISAAQLEQRLREVHPPVIARVKEEEILLDLRTIREEEEKELQRVLKEAFRVTM